MKKRCGFVSNSSSNSFILRNEQEVKHAKELGMELYRVSDIIAKIKPMVDVINGISKLGYDNSIIPCFMMDEYNYQSTPPYYNDLVELEEKSPGCYITSAYDRDCAYRQGLKFDIFEGDL